MSDRHPPAAALLSDEELDTIEGNDTPWGTTFVRPVADAATAKAWAAALDSPEVTALVDVVASLGFAVENLDIFRVEKRDREDLRLQLIRQGYDALAAFKKLKGGG